MTYGTSRDLAADLIEITTDYTRRHDSACPLEYELSLAEHRDAAIARGDAVVCEPPFGLGAPAGPLGRSATALLVDGRPCDAELLTCGRYRALRFEQGPLLVTAALPPWISMPSRSGQTLPAPRRVQAAAKPGDQRATGL